MKRILFIFFFVFLFHCGLAAQTGCPGISISGPSGVSVPGDTITFTAAVDTKGEALKLEYLWSTEAGEIVSGQGTNAITVKVSGVSISATVEIKGLPEGCPNLWTEHSIGDPSPQPELIESFKGPITAKDKARFEKINAAMREDQSAGYIFFVAGKDMRQIQANRDTIIKYLRTPEDLRVTFVYLAAGTEVTEVWRVPPGANDPNPGESRQ
jgi:hypothetical protein